MSTYPGRAAALAVGSPASEPRKGTSSTWYKLSPFSTVIATGDLAPSQTQMDPHLLARSPHLSLAPKKARQHSSECSPFIRIPKLYI